MAIPITRRSRHEPSAAPAATRFPLSYGIFRLARAHGGYAAQLLRQHGLHRGQELIIMALAEQGPQPQMRLAEIERLDHSTIAHSLRRMEAAGLVSRRPSPDDGRATLVSLTKKGRTVHLNVLAVWAELERAATAHLEKTAQSGLVDAMRVVERGILDRS